MTSPPTSQTPRKRVLGSGSAAIFAIGIVVVFAPTVVAAQQTRISATEWQRVLAVEDSRTNDPDSLRVLIDAIRDPRAPLRAVAARAIGRFERPSLLPELYARVADPSPAVRREVVNAIAQIARPASRVADSVWRPAVDTLMSALSREKDADVVASLAESLGRLARGDSSAAPIAERLMALLGAEDESGASVSLTASPRVVLGVMKGVYSAGRTRRDAADTARARRDPGAAELRMIRYGLRGTAAQSAQAVQVRRLSVLSLISPAVRTDSVALVAMRDPDPQMRRLAVLAAASAEDSAVRRQVLQSALHDLEFIVRFDAVRSWRRLFSSECAPVVAATHDRHPAVMLAAIDALSGCGDRGLATDALFPLATSDAPAARRAGRASWHPRAHALVSLARVAPERAEQQVKANKTHPVWQVRMYTARAATILKDVATLSDLASDSVADVQEAAITGLAAVSPRAADAFALRALSHPAYQVVLAAASALKGAPVTSELWHALLTSLGRLTAEQRENARDPRVALLERVGELGDVSLARQIEPYVRDFDPEIAERAARIVTRWTGGGREVAAAPAVRRVISNRLGALYTASSLRLKITMDAASGGGTWVIKLRPDVAPATVARLLELVGRGYYNGLTFHRVEPTFVIQGGSPSATEYVGDGPFMRDEVALLSHVYGTVGISTRGRDTGDAQIFVNLTDNFRLDHDYTVVGDVVEGMSVVDDILEGDTMARVAVVGVR